MTESNPLETWLAEVCTALEIDAAVLDRDAILALARDVAHNVARPAAPLTTFLVGLAAGAGGGNPESVRAAAATAQRLALARAD